MKYQLLSMLSYLISRTPGNGLRVLLYRLVFGYDLINTAVGYGTRIYCGSFKAHNCRIGPFNSFVGPFSISFGNNCTVGRKNRFSCDGFAVTANYPRVAEIGDESNLSNEHYIDLAGKLVIGSKTWLGGVGTQIWTHGPGAKGRLVEIGSNCYIGSASLLGPGAAIGDSSMVAMGACVTQSYTDSHLLIGGIPSRVIREGFDWTKWESTKIQQDPAQRV